MSTTTPTPAALAALTAAAADPASLTMTTIRATLAAAGFPAPRRLRRAALLGALADAATTAAAATPPPPVADPEPPAGALVMLTPDTAGDAVPLVNTAAPDTRPATRVPDSHRNRAALLVSLGAPGRGYLTHRADGEPETGAVVGAAAAATLAVLAAAVVVAVDARPLDNRPALPGPAAAVLDIDGEPVPVTAPAVLVPTSAIRAALGVSIDLRPWYWSPRAKGGHARKYPRPLAGYAVKPATKTRPASFQTVKGYPLADVLAAIAGLRPGQDTAPAGTGPWCSVVQETAEAAGVEGLRALVSDVSTTAAVLAAVETSPDLGALADVYRDHLAALAAAVGARRADGKAAGVAGRAVKRDQSRRARFTDTAATVRRRRVGGQVVKTRRGQGRKGGKR